MWFLGLGLALMLFKWMEWGPFGGWAWWQTLVPLGLAVLWWAWADWSGYTKRQRFKKEEERHQKRIDRLKKDMGTLQRPK
jgi:small Trp-rich protein